MRLRAARGPNTSLIVSAASLGAGRRAPRPALVAALAVALAGGGAVAAAALAPESGAGLTDGVVALSGGASDRLGRIADALPLGYAFGAGMVAAVNPCGVALLPAYLGLHLGERGRARAKGA